MPGQAWPSSDDPQLHAEALSEPSNTEALARVVIDALESTGVRCANRPRRATGMASVLLSSYRMARTPQKRRYSLDAR
jgi:hypothetical protein